MSTIRTLSGTIFIYWLLINQALIEISNVTDFFGIVNWIALKAFLTQFPHSYKIFKQTTFKCLEFLAAIAITDKTNIKTSTSGPKYHLFRNSHL